MSPNPPKKSDEIIRQVSHYSALTGNTVPSTNLVTLRKLVLGATPEPVYRQHGKVAFWYEILAADGWWDTVRELLILPWIANRANIDRVARTVGRRNSDEPPIIAACMIRFKTLKNNSGWKQMNDDLRIPTKGRPKPQTTVFYTVEDWSSDNGFFMDLPAGSDVCIDCATRLWLPGTGGGAGILFALDI